MKLQTLAVANAVVLLAVSFVVAQDDVPDPMQMDAGAPVQNSGKMLDCCCCNQSTWIFEAEATFFRYHRADGVGVNPNAGEFDFNASPRLTLGYVGADGMGARIRYWDYDHDATINGANHSVDTYNIDFEIFQVVELNCCTSLEVSAGIRYNDFEEVPQVVLASSEFDGIGGMIAVELHRDLGNGLGVYARLREAIMMDDWATVPNDLTDVTRPVTEIAFGVDYCSCNWSIHAGLEWQNWGNYAVNQFDGLNQSPEDVGFAGVVIGAEYAY